MITIHPVAVCILLTRYQPTGGVEVERGDVGESEQGRSSDRETERESRWRGWWIGEVEEHRHCLGDGVMVGGKKGREGEREGGEREKGKRGWEEHRTKGTKLVQTSN